MKVEYFKKPTLIKGNVYAIEKPIEEYPFREKIEAEYLGSSETREHVFGRNSGSNEFIIAEDRWVMEVDGVITYKPITPSRMINLTRDKFQVFSDAEKSRLRKILADVGVQL